MTGSRWLRRFHKECGPCQDGPDEETTIKVAPTRRSSIAWNLFVESCHRDLYPVLPMSTRIPKVAYKALVPSFLLSSQQSCKIKQSSRLQFSASLLKNNTHGKQRKYF